MAHLHHLTSDLGRPTEGDGETDPCTDDGSRAVRLLPAGDEAVLVEFGAVVDRALHQRVRALAVALTDEAAGDTDWLIDVVPAYASVLVRYDPDRIGYAALVQHLHKIIQQSAEVPLPGPKRIEVPVRYGGSDGPDLAFVASYTGLSEADVIKLHSEPTYVVYMLGFTPGFCYLGDLPTELAVPRRDTPRVALPAGAVAVGGGQTGVYSLDNSPGGWRWIGKTDIRLWDARRRPPSLLQAGDEVRFVPV